MHCYERASRPREVAVANAFFLRETARSTPLVPRQSALKRSKAFLIASDAFLACAVDATRDKRAYLRNAAECFVHGGDNRKAAWTYLEAEEFTAAAELFHKEGMVDEAVNIIKSHRTKMQDDVAESIIGVARLYYFKEHKFEYVSIPYRGRFLTNKFSAKLATSFLPMRTSWSSLKTMIWILLARLFSSRRVEQWMLRKSTLRKVEL